MSEVSELYQIGPERPIYHLEPSEVPYSPNQYLDRDFFATPYSKAALEQDNKKRRRKDNN